MGKMVISTTGMTSEKKKMLFLAGNMEKVYNGLGRNFSIREDLAGAFERKAVLSEIHPNAQGSSPSFC